MRRPEEAPDRQGVMMATHNEVFDEVLLRARQRNTAVLNAFRPIGAAGFVLIQVWLNEVTPGTKVLLIYALLATVIFILSRSSDHVARWSAMAIPFFDMPCLFFKQWLDMVPGISTDHRALANFTLSAFILLIMLSAFTLRSNRLFLSGGIALGLQTTLLLKSHDVTVGLGGSCVALLLALALCEFALSQHIRMLHAIADETLRRERLQRYFSPDVAAFIQQTNPTLETGQQFEITVLFSDLRGFTATAQAASPAEVVALLNQVNAALVEQVLAHHGTIDKFIGDGLMAYFGAPVPDAQHPNQAFQCARDMLRTIQQINHARAERHLPPLRLSVGLHTGTAVIGAVGTVNRREFTAIGDTVNVAARIEQLNRQFNTDLLISGDTFRRLTSPPLRFIAETSLRGRAEPVRIFGLDPGPPPA